MIAIVACLSLSVDLHNENSTKELDEIEAMNGKENGDAVEAYILGKMNYLSTSRPTAVNLFNALAELKEAVTAAKNENGENGKTPRQRMVEAVAKHAEFMLHRDIDDNRKIGKHGADEILEKTKKADVSLMTICNTGSLATASYGTALGVVRALRDQNKLNSIVALETRPYNQGSRLTAFELTEEKMPGAMLISDSMAAARMREHSVDAVVVGADRVCANGDTANKIGTYNLAIVAAAHGVPFYVASPFTTLDTSLATGDEIHIEERPAHELLNSSQAPSSIDVWNPAFDVTPARYITGIITEKGILHPNADGIFDVPGFVAKHKA